MSETSMPVEIFCSYAPADETFFQQLQKHLSLLVRQEGIVFWHNRRISPGIDWAQAIDTQVSRASVILLLISADFLASDYCYGVEMKRALERQSMNEARVIPILIRPVDWEQAPFNHLSVLPTDAKPISQWHNRDDAFKDVVRGIRVALEDIQHLTFATPLSAFPRLWNIPYAPNPFFTGQEALLTQLANTLKMGQPTALSQPQAISGLGGIGKTQIAVEYAYRHRQDYQAIFWVRADTHESLVSAYTALAEMLSLPKKDERDQTIIVQEVEQWFKTHREWLLILDNADDLSIINIFLRSLFGGHILLTTRAHAVGPLAQRIEVEIMSQNVGTLFLLRRAGLIGLDTSLDVVPASERATAQKIIEELGGLPLALDQAGAYIEETGCSLAAYQQVYQQHRIEMLRRRGSFSKDYPFSVATTWTLTFEKIKRQSPVAADLLYCCALLYPDAIPEELFTKGSIYLGSRLKRMAFDSWVFDEVVRIPLAYSLIHRDPMTAMLSIHRLVQVMLVDTMTTAAKKRWRERIVRAVNEIFPEVALEEWTKCERLLPHALICVTGIKPEPISIPETLYLLHKVGIYLRERGQYSEAEPLLIRALSIREQELGTEHPDTVRSLHNLAELYRRQGKYEQAEPLFQRALSIQEQQLGAEHPDTARSLNDLAVLYHQQGKYEQAEPLYQRALSIREQQLGAEHPDTAKSLNNLAVLYHQQGKYEQVESLYQQAFSIKERLLGPEHPNTALSLNNLAELYRQQGKYEQAEPLFQRTLSIYEQHLGTDHPNTAYPLHGLAELYRYQGKYEQAEQLHQRALSIREQHLEVDHPDTAYSLHGLAEVYRHQGKYEQAETLYQRALAIREQQLGPTHPDTREIRRDYAAFLRTRGRDAEATMLVDTSHEPSAEGDR